MSDEPDDFDEEEPFDASNRRHVGKRKRTSRLFRDEHLLFLGAAMGHPQGRAFLHDLLAFCRVWKISHVIGDPYETAFLEGQRNIGLRVLAGIQACHGADQYITMIKEAKEATRQISGVKQEGHDA